MHRRSHNATEVEILKHAQEVPRSCLYMAYGFCEAKERGDNENCAVRQ